MNRDDRHVDGRGFEEPDDLRSVLQLWQVPGAPPEIADYLRRVFRRRRSRRQVVAWLAVAAGLALVFVTQMRWRDHPVDPANARVRAPAPTPAPRLAVATQRVESPARTTSSHRAIRVPTLRSAKPDVIVEPGQAELLTRLAQQLNGLCQVAPGASWPRIEEQPMDTPPAAIPSVGVVQIPSYRMDWVARNGQWLPVHQPL
jgi:hypothetical protein